MKFNDLFSLSLKEILSLLISLPITVYVNFRCLPFRTALKLPLFIGYKTRLGHLSRNITFGCEPKTFMVRIGWGGTEGRERGKRVTFCLTATRLSDLTADAPCPPGYL